MGILWFILKIILFVLLALLSIVIIGIVIIIVMPIRYEAYMEKYDALMYECKFTYLKWIRGHFYLEDGIKKHEIRAFGKLLYQDKTKVEEVLKNTVDHQEEQVANKADSSSTKQVVKKETKVETKVDAPVLKESQEKADRLTNNIEEETKDFVDDLDSFQIKELILNKDFYRLLKEIYRFLKDLIKYILPRKWSYELIIGKENPADTGELIAKLTLLYPLYYKHGIIRGDFQNAGISGGFLAQGKFNIYGILRRILKFLLKPVVTKYIKWILKIRKE